MINRATCMLFYNPLTLQGLSGNKGLNKIYYQMLNIGRTIYRCAGYFVCVYGVLCAMFDGGEGSRRGTPKHRYYNRIPPDTRFVIF